MSLKARLAVIQRPLVVIQRPLAVIQRPLTVIQRPMHFTTNLLFGFFHVTLPFGSRADSKSPLSFAPSGRPEFAISVEVSTSLPQLSIDFKGVKGGGRLSALTHIKPNHTVD